MISMGIEKDRPCNNMVCRIKIMICYALFFLLNTSAGSWARTIATNMMMQPLSSLTDIF